MTKPYYQILGVSEIATLEEIKKSYRKLAQQWHPDKWTTKSLDEREEANKKMQEINRAYEILSDVEKRKRYDLGMDDFLADSGYQYDYEEELRRQKEELRRKELHAIDLELKILKLEIKALDRSSTLNEIGAAFCFTFPRVRAEDINPSLWQPYQSWGEKVVKMEITIPDGKQRSEELKNFTEEIKKAIKEAETSLKIRENKEKKDRERQNQKDSINSELDRARTDAFEYIEKEMIEKGLKDEDLREYSNYKEQINNLDQVYKIRDLREEVLIFISKLERRREPEYRQDDYYPSNDRSRENPYNPYPPREQPDYRFPNDSNFPNDKPRQNSPHYPPQEPRGDPHYSPQPNPNPRFPENPRQPERFPNRHEDSQEREQERGIVNISNGICNGKYDNWTREELIAEIEKEKLNNVSLQRLVNLLETRIKELEEVIQELKTKLKAIYVS